VIPGLPFALTPGLPLGLTPGLPLGLLPGFPLARTLVIPFALVASPKLGLRQIRAKQGRWNPRYMAMVKEEFDKLLEAGFIRPMETTKWVSPMVLALKKNGKLRVCVNYKALNKVTKKNRYLLPFYEEILEEVVGHEM